VPGVLWVSPEGELCAGRHVGYSELEPAWQRSTLTRLRRIEDWSHAAWLVERSSLRRAVVDEHALIVPETLIDGAELPNAHRWLADQRLVCVSGLKARRLAEAGVRVFQLSAGTADDDGLHLRIGGGDLPEIDFRADRQTLVLPAGNDEPTNNQLSIIDRLLRRLSDGALTEAGVCAALTARCFVEDGYGYQGAPAGQFRSVDDITAEARALDQAFAPIFDRARSQLDDAKALRRALPKGSVDAAEIDVPLYRRARRVLTEARSLPLEGQHGKAAIELRIGDGVRTTLELPAANRWFVERVAPWSPPALAAAMAVGQRSRTDRVTTTVKVAALCVLAALAVVVGVIAQSCSG
jgi:hypothetical protein